MASRLRLTEAVARNAMEEICVLPSWRHHDLYITLILPLDVLLLPEALSRIAMRTARCSRFRSSGC